MKQIVLQGESAQSVAKSILKNDPEVSNRLSEHMQKHRKKQLLKKLIYKHKNFLLFNPKTKTMCIVSMYLKHNFPKKLIFVLV
jgi:hypothetical protein